MEAPLSAREGILSDIRARRVRSAPRPSPYRLPDLPKESVAQFTDRARAAGADVRQIANPDEIPAAIANALRERNLSAVVHLPPDTKAEALRWDSVPGITLCHDAPGPDDAALSFVPYAIGETGTLAFASSAERPASWHFRPGLEIAVVYASAILPHLEEVLSAVKASGTTPHTVNLVTGPSRTGDIEQTLELGAHGPKALVVLVVDDA